MFFHSTSISFHKLKNPILCSTSSELDLSGLLGFLLLCNLLGCNLRSFLKPLEFDMILPHSPFLFFCFNLFITGLPFLGMIPWTKPWALQTSISFNTYLRISSCALLPPSLISVVCLGFYFSAACWVAIFGLSLSLLSLIRSFHIRLSNSFASISSSLAYPS